MLSGSRPRHVWLKVQSLHAPPQAPQPLQYPASHSSAEAEQTWLQAPIAYLCAVYFKWVLEVRVFLADPQFLGHLQMRNS